jgi:hypothetical protein
MNSASLCSLTGRYDNPIPPQFLAPIDFLKIPALFNLSCLLTLGHQDTDLEIDIKITDGSDMPFFYLFISFLVHEEVQPEVLKILLYFNKFFAIPDMKREDLHLTNPVEYHYHRVGRVLSLSPVVGNGTPPTHHPQARVPPPL